MLLTATFAYTLSTAEIEVPFRLSEKVPAGIPKFELPKMSAQLGNETVELQEIVLDIGSGLILLPLVSILANVAIAKSFSKLIR